MVGYMSLEEQVDADFTRARRKAFLRRVSARLRRVPTPNRLPCFDEVRKRLGAAGGVRRGRRTVRLTDIVGSVSRCSEFDGIFLPLRESARTKWERIGRAFHRGEELPPVELYKVGGSYFALDGNHRISVARYHGVEWIDAEVTEFGIPSPPEPTRVRTAEEPTEHTTSNESPRGGPDMRETMDLEVWKRRHEELLREAEENRQVKALRATGKRRAGRSSALAWELRRHAGVLLKLLRTLRNVG